MTWRYTGDQVLTNADYPPGFPLVESSDITSWSSWPDDVRDRILRFNQRGSGHWRLSFYGAPRVFKCAGCQRFCKRQKGGTAHVYHKAHRKDANLFCDECMILAARRAAA